MAQYEMRKEDLVMYKVNCLLNEMGVFNCDSKNLENDRQCDEIKTQVQAQILELINRLPKVPKSRR